LRAKVSAREPIWRRMRKVAPAAEAARALLEGEGEEDVFGLGEDMMGSGRGCPFGENESEGRR
jgi:hypothetical protein